MKMKIRGAARALATMTSSAVKMAGRTGKALMQRSRSQKDDIDPADAEVMADKRMYYPLVMTVKGSEQMDVQNCESYTGSEFKEKHDEWESDDRRYEAATAV